MEGVTAIRIIRQVRIINLVGINESNMTSPIIQQQPEQLPPSPPRNPRCINFIALLVIYFIGIGSIVLGATHINDCPAEKMLPKALIIFGGMLIVARLMNCALDCRSICEEVRGEDPPPCFTLLNVIFLLAEFGMFIAVSYYAFSIHPSTDPVFYNMMNYCHYGLYKTSFIGCIIMSIFYGLVILLTCCKACSKLN